jgi:putative transposase
MPTSAIEPAARAYHSRDPQRARVVGTFPDGNSATNLAAARPIAGTRWSTKRYLNIEVLRQRNAMIA